MSSYMPTNTGGKMLFFKILTDENRNVILDFLSENITDIDKDYAEEILDSLL